MNFSELKVEVKELTGRNDSRFDTRVEKALNRALRDWARILPWDGLRKVDNITHQGGRHLVFPADVDRVVWILDTTNYRPVQASDGQWDRADPYGYGNDTVNYADEWDQAGKVPTLTGVSGPMAIYSSAASDVVTVYFQGQVLAAGGTAPRDLYRWGESVSIVGTTPVTTSASYYSLDSIVKDADTDGVLTVESQGTVVARIDPFERESKYVQVSFLQIPVAATVFRYAAYTRPTPLVSAYQTTHPSVEQDYLVWAAAADVHWQLKEGTRGTAAKRRAEEIAAKAMGKERQFGDWSGRLVPEDLT